MRKISILLAAWLALIILPQAAHALDSAAQGDDGTTVFLVSGVEGVGQETTIPLGLDIRLAPGWHTYWRSPGEAGLPPSIDWTKSKTEDSNLKSVTLYYPAPKRYSAFGLETIGYREHVLLPIDAELRTPGKPLNIEANLDLLVCSQICVPKHFILKLTVPAGEAKPSPDAAHIKSFRDQVPGDAAQSGLAIKKVSNDGQNLTVEITSKDPLQAPDVFVENDKDVEFSAPTVSIAPDKLSASLTVKPTAPLPDDVTLGNLLYNFTVIDDGHALEQKYSAPETTAATSTPAPAATPRIGTETPVPAPPIAPATPVLPLWLMIIFAIIGGLILNLMPCVLPVLSLKLLSVISHGGGEERVVRHSFLVTAAGILFSFLALAVMTIALKEAGMAVGWGIQFQQPVFLCCLIILLTFFAANMWGLVEIAMPRWLADNLTGPYHPKLAGDFATGAFATLLATPCSAPFLGTAVGFALASGPGDILIIFTALGFGMTLPYLAAAFWPHLATALPKPGHWMVILRYVLGWALALATLWLIWVLAVQISTGSAFAVGICMLVIIGLLTPERPEWRPYVYAGIIISALVALGIVLTGSLAPKPNAEIDAGWQMFNEDALAQDVTQGKTVFVDVTAAWCLTCKANQKFILSREDIQERLFHSDVIPMQADWTNPNPAISAFLQKYRRYAIPFNIVFGPGSPQGIALPELLSADAVTKALDKAEKK